MPSKKGMGHSYAKGDSDNLAEFIDDIAGDDLLRIEEDFGQGFVRLRSSEAERRQAAQDIRSSEDVIIELMRNSKDAGANNIYIATGKVGDSRSFVVIDDGSGIPEQMRTLIFQPRITSKLDSAHMDKWGLHGRGMALYSISENSTDARVVYSSLNDGTSMKVTLSLNDIGEKTDQSTFPIFEIVDDVFTIRGPKNILRVVCEFAIENRKDAALYIGSSTEVASSLYANGIKMVPAKQRIFGNADNFKSPAEMLACASDPLVFQSICSKLGLEISSRSARRILDGQIAPLSPVFSKVLEAISPEKENEGELGESKIDLGEIASTSFKAHFTKPDLKDFEAKVSKACSELCDKYYLENSVPRISVRKGKMHIEIDIQEGGQ